MTASRLGEEVVSLATRLTARIAIAESLTGGMLTDAIVSIPGASRVLSGGIVAYDTSLKRTLLGVDAGLLHRRGPVDREVAIQMAAGVRVACATPRTTSAAAPADFGIATTGVAGPDPDPQTGQPAGTVWIAVAWDGGVECEELACSGDRAAVRKATVVRALELLHRVLASVENAAPHRAGTDSRYAGDETATADRGDPVP